MTPEELAAALTARIGGYEFHTSMCGDRKVLKLSVAEAMQVIEPFLLEQQATITWGRDANADIVEVDE